MAFDLENVKTALVDKTIKKVIVVPGRVINIVAV
jgi:leucyl-tRNA synthetase